MNNKKNNMQPIPIILTTYRRLHFLKQTIEKIKERTFYPHKLIVVYNKPENEEDEDGTKDYLKHAVVVGTVDKVVWLDRNAGQADSQNEGLKLVGDAPYFVLTQDDLIPPDLRPCWLERLVHLIEENEDFGSICMRIQRTKRVDWEETGDLIENFKSIPAVFRIHRTSEIEQFGEKPFGLRKHWESHSCAKLMEELKKKMAMATHLYADHIGFMAENKGYIGGFDRYYTYSKERVKQGEDKPYPDIDERTNIPIKLNHLTDFDEHQKRLDYWGLDTGVQSGGETKRKWKQRYELGQYCETHPGKWADMGCGTEKCHKDAIGIDTSPTSVADIIHPIDDLWFFKDGELDGITSCHSLEHLVDTKKVLQEWSRVLKLGGLMAIIVPDGIIRPSTIREPSHKVALTEAVLTQLMSRVLGYKILRLEHVPNIDARKASIICVAKKRLK